MSDLSKIFDDERDENLYSKNSKAYIDIVKNRASRKAQAYNSYMAAGNFSAAPYQTLDTLTRQLTTHQELNERFPSDVLADTIARIQSRIQNNNYVINGSPEFTYNENRKNYASNFVWPTAEELLIREQEKQDCLSLLA